MVAFLHKHRQLLMILAASWLARLLFVGLVPDTAVSCDTVAWDRVAIELGQGHNPYKETSVLNWPPFWMQLVWLIDKATLLLHVPFVRGLQVFLVTVESFVVMALYRFLRQNAPNGRIFWALLLGIALNPMAIFLVGQHLNFDVLVGLWILLFVGQLVRYQQSQNELDWLLACFFLGLGILTKTVPLVLCPMLAGGWRAVNWKTRALGTALVLGPVTLGMSIIYVLAPTDVAIKVLGYRSSSGWFGISGLLNLAGLPGLIRVTDILFYLLLLTAGGAVAWIFWNRKQLAAREIVLCAALILAAIPTIGPGYGPQYLYWHLPLFIITYVLYDRRWRGLLWVFWVVGVLTYLWEYSLVPSHGYFLIHSLFDANGNPTFNQKTKDALIWCGTQNAEILLRLPLFAISLFLLATGTRKLVADLNDRQPG